LASLGKLVTFNFAGAPPIRNFSRPLRIVSEGGAAVQTGYDDQAKNKCLHLVLQFDLPALWIRVRVIGPRFARTRCRAPE
jgi:hypothetical protein